MSHQNRSHDRPRIPIALALSIGVIASSTSSIFIRFAQAEASSLVIAVYRLCIATLILLPILFVRYRSELKKMTIRQITLAVAAGLFLAVHFTTWITSLEFTTVASSVALVQTSPLIVALVSPLLLKEALTRNGKTGLAVSLFGSIIVGMSDACTWSNGLQCPPLREFLQGTAIKGDMLALAGAAAGAGYLIIGRRLRGSVALIPYITLAYGTAALTLTTQMFLTGHQPFGYSPTIYLWMVLLALIPQLLAHSTYNWALKYLSAALVSITWLGEPVGSTILAYFILRESPPIIRLAGAALILTGITIASKRADGESSAGET